MTRATKTRPALTDEQVAARRAAGRRAAHSSKMEGLPCDPAHEDLHEALVTGRITKAELSDALLDRLRAERPDAFAS